jgi:hypothetical protein
MQPGVNPDDRESVVKIIISQNFSNALYLIFCPLTSHGVVRVERQFRSRYCVCPKLEDSNMQSTVVFLAVVAMAGMVALAAVVPAPERENVLPGGLTACTICKDIIAIIDTIGHNSQVG